MINNVLLLSLLFSSAPGVNEVPYTLNVGVESVNNPPMYWNVNGYQYKGFTREVLDLFAKQNQITLDYQMLPIKRLYLALVREDVDIKIPDNPLWKRDFKVKYPVVYSDSFLNIRAGLIGFNVPSDIPISDIKVISMPRGYSLLNLKESDLNRVKVFETPTVESCLEMAFTKRTQGCYANLAAVNYLIENKLEQYRGLKYELANFPYQDATYHISTVSSPDMISMFNHFLKINDEQIKQLKRKYFLSVQ